MHDSVRQAPVLLEGGDAVVVLAGVVASGVEGVHLFGGHAVTVIPCRRDNVLVVVRVVEVADRGAVCTHRS